MEDFYPESLSLFEYTRSLRRDFHRHPELGFREVRTAGIVARELGALGLEVTSGVAETGVIGLIEGAQPGPVALLRFDMDALPIREETGLEFASTVPGAMHACGHDAHVAIGLTVARLLTEHREALHGAVKLVFQPAEEGLGGAEAMLAAGVLENPKVDFTLALHVWNELPTGTVAAVPGALMAGAEIFKIVLTGVGAHGAMPQNGVDPVYAAAQVITALQSVVSRNVSPLEAAVVSVCQVKAGDTFNVIPQTAELSGTIRTFEPAVRERVVARFEQVVRGVASALGCQAEVEVKRLTPAVINDAALAAAVARAARETLPGVELVENYRQMVSEDMAYLMEKVPGCYFLVGSKNPEVGASFGHHHPRFTIDEEAMPKAAALMAAAALDLLGG